jgi:hypothetical protein
VAEWISVKERMPEDGEFVLIYGVGYTQAKLGFVNKILSNGMRLNFWNRLDPTLQKYEIPWVGAGVVTHWMPLPEPPKEGGGEDG